MAACTRNVRVDEDEEPYRKSSTATIRSEGTGTQYYSKHGGIQPMYDSSDNSSLDSYRSSTASQMRIRRVSSSFDGSSRFPKLQECAHFHYDIVELPELQFSICDEEQENYHHNGEEVMDRSFLVKVTCNNKSWNVKRTFKNFRMLDRQLHRCIFDRRFSRLPDLLREENGDTTYQEMEEVLASYMEKLSELAGSNINCGSILNWFELDNRGNRLLVLDDSGINTPAIAAAHAVKRYTAQAVDEISLEVGDIVSVIDMPPPEDSLWWRGKRGFEVGFFPSECVEVIGDKVPVSMQTNIPLGSSSKKPLVRKHGKFLSFLRMFFSTRPARIELKQSGIVKERVFGCDLGEHLLNSGHDVPLVLKSCSEIIEEYGIVDGIYRLSGITSNIQKIRHAFDEDRVPDLTEEIYLQDIHSISSLLKMYFRELPNPLLTYQLYDKFADAVRDEDNKLWKIHDVVQQLPPPHYRTTEFLMRHLAKVAAFGTETGMHSKNLAIVWAPNLLRSKELECGGGAAALQGVGIQAVVTECLILYADLIFSDKMPNYSSPELKQSRKKPRPKSLAISTPTKLITLEEARERVLLSGLRPPSQNYIDVGGGPKNLPDRYHTVIDLPGYRKKTPLREVGNIKGKKSPSGWRSIFTKSNRQGSVKQKALKGSMTDSLSQLDRKAITEEDVHNWKRRRLRGAKSAESLINLPSSNRDSTHRMSRLIDENTLMKIYSDENARSSTRHKRSLSSESPRSLTSGDNSVSYPSFIMAGSREVPIDVDTSVVPDESSASNSDSPDVSATKKQLFVRNETKRRVVTPRKVPSAPSTPRSDSENREKSCSPKAAKQKMSSSAIHTDSKEIKIVKQDIVPNAADSDKFVLRVEDTNLLKPKDSVTKSASTSKEEGHKGKGTKTPPSGRKDARTPSRERRKSAEDKKSHTQVKEASPTVQTEKVSDKGREIMTIDLPESPGAKRKNWIGSTGSTPASTPDDPPVHNYFSRHHDYAVILSDSEDVQKKPLNQELTVADNIDLNRLSDSYDNLDPMFFLPHSPPDHEMASEVNSEPRKEEVQYGKILSKTSSSFDDARSKGNVPSSKISKCLSVPSDIQKSLENMTSGSQTDMLSSVTISEVSSLESFNLPDDGKVTQQQKRRSASLDSLTEKDSPLTRTLIEINAQIDRAFKSEVERARQIKTEHNQQLLNSSHDTNTLRSEYDVPQLESPGTYDNCMDDQNTGVDVFEAPRLLRAPLRPAGAQTQSQNAKIVKQSSLDSSVSMETSHTSSSAMSESHTTQDVHSMQYFSQSSSSQMYVQKAFQGTQYSESIHSSETHSNSQVSTNVQYDRLNGIEPSGRIMGNSSTSNSSEKLPSQNLFSEEKFASYPSSSPHRPQQFTESPIYSKISKPPIHSPPLGSPSQSQQSTHQSRPPTKANSVHDSSQKWSSITSPQSAPESSPLTSPVSVTRRPKSIHRGSFGATSPQGQGWPLASPSSSPGQARSSSSQGSSPFMSPTSPQQSRGFDVRRSQSRHGRVTFDLSEEDLNFLSQQGKKQEKQKASDSYISSSSSSVSSSPESRLKKENAEGFHPSQPAKREFPHLLLSSAKSCETSGTSSPRSPRQQPRWEDLAGLNQDFRAMAGLDRVNSVDSVEREKQHLTSSNSNINYPADNFVPRNRSSSDSCVVEDTSFERKLQDLSDFNEIWRKQLAPTGDVCRHANKSDTRANAGNTTEQTRMQASKEEQVSNRRHQLRKSSTIAAMEMAAEYTNTRRERTPECGMEERVLVVEKPMIKKCLTESDIPQIKHCSIMTQDSASTTSSSGTSDLHSFAHDSCTGGNDREVHGHHHKALNVRNNSESKQNSQNSIPTQSVACSNIDKDSQSVGSSPIPSKIQKMETKDIKLNMPMLPPLELSGFPQFENSGLIPTTGASINQQKEDEAKNKRDSDVTIYENDPLPPDLDIRDFDTIGDASVNRNITTQIDTSLPMTDEFDINESCFGIPSHQNLSNEMREKAQERLRASQRQLYDNCMDSNLQGVETLPLDALVFPTAVLRVQDGTVVVQEHSNQAMNGLQGDIQLQNQMDFEATLQYGSGEDDYVYSNEDIQMLSQGPILTAEPFILDQLEPHNTVSRQVDNTEEAAQNEINADRELSMTLQNSLNQDVKGWEYEDVSCQNSANSALQNPSCPNSDLPNSALYNSNLQNLPTSGLSHMRLVSPAEAFMDVDHQSQSCVALPELAPPPREFLEVSRPKMVRKNIHLKAHQNRKPHSTGVLEASSDKGENEILVEHRASFKKKAPVPLPKTKSLGSRPKEELVDPNDIIDDVFVDDVKSTITQSRLLRRPCGSLATFVFPTVMPCESSNRSSLDESVLQMASDRHDDFTGDESENERREDIRFTRAHRSTKLQSLKELFEKSCGDQTLNDSEEKLLCLSNTTKQENDYHIGATSSAQTMISQSERSHQEVLRTRSSPVHDAASHTLQTSLNSPRSRRSISTDVGYEFRSTRGVPMTSAKPPKHRSSSRPRTPSESSMSEIDSKFVGSKGSPKSNRLEDSQRSAIEGSSSTKSSPKSQRDASPLGYISGDDSPRSVRSRTDGSPKGIRHVSFKRTESFEQMSPKGPRSWSSNRSVTIDTGDVQPEERMSQSFGGNLAWQTSELWRAQRSRRAMSVETSEQRSNDFMSKSLTDTQSSGSVLERKGSIKELMNFFESKTEGQGHDDDAIATAAMTTSMQRSRQRVHSVSPTSGLGQALSHSAESLSVTNIRRSLELPANVDIDDDSMGRPQSVRVGPKPFYGSQL